MEHQVPGLVFVHGEWVDVYRIIARAQQQAGAEMREPISKPQNRVPKLGILSRTVFDSPFIKSVLSANIRHKTLNDVVFIGEDAVHIKEIQAYGHLRHAATKSDFPGRILAAKVFGEPRKVQIHADYGKPWNRAAVHAERTSFTASEADAIPPEMILLTLSSRKLMFLWARQTLTGSVRFHQRTFRLPAEASRHERLGAFLAVDPKCRAVAVAATEGRFMLYKTRTLDAWRENLRTGQDVAPIVDERLIFLKGRIMHMDFLSQAKSGDESHVVLLFVLIHKGTTKITCYDWDCRTDLSTASVRAERVSVDTEDHNPSLLIPLSQSSDFLLVCNKHISLYSKVLSGSLPRIRCEIPGFIHPPRRPGDGTSTPRWVQWDKVPRNPAFSKEAFYIAREDGMVIYSELVEAFNSVETSEAGIWPFSLDKAFATLDVDISPRALSYPDVLIAAGAASDGLLCKVGAYPTQYNLKTSYPANNTFSPVESISNWAPITDLAITRLSSVRIPHERERDAIFIANGRAPHGTVSELRRGLKATVDIPTRAMTGMTGCTGLWVIDHGSETIEDDGNDTKQHYAVLLFNLPPESIVIRISRTQKASGSQQGASWSSWEEGVWSSEQVPNGDDPVQDDILRDDETISATLFDDHFAVQVTRKEARVLQRTDLSKVDSVSFASFSEGSINVLVAATGSQLPCIAIVFRENASRIILRIIAVSEQGTFGNTISHELDADPTCLQLLEIGGVPHVFVGTADSAFTLYKIQESGILFSVHDDVLDQGPSTGLRMLCESAVVLGSGDNPVLVCGTRNGFLLAIFLEVTEERYNVLSTRYTRMGTTAAQVTRCATDSFAAFVACGSDTCRIRISQSGSYSIDVDSIWFTDGDNSGYKQSPVTALDQLPFTQGVSADKDLGGFIFTVSGDSMLFAQLDCNIRWSNYDFPLSTLEQQKATPRKLATNATPTKLMYMEKLKRMVVATNEAKEERAPSMKCAGYRIVHSAIQVLRLGDDETEINAKQEEELDLETNSLVTSEFTLKHYERVYSMIEWTFVDGKGKVFHFVVVGTGVASDSGESGRRLFLNVNEKGIRLKKESPYEQPVRCMTLYNENQLVTIVGKTIIFEEYEHQAAKWIRRGQKELTSPGVHLTASRPFVYVSTAHDSHICYEVVFLGDLHQGRVEFKQIFTDSRQRNAAHHLVIPLSLSTTPFPLPPQNETETGNDSLPDASPISPDSEINNATIVIVTDKTCNITGLYHPPQATHKSATDTLFEASLPRSITRLARGQIRPPWRRPCADYTSSFPTTVPGIVCDDIIGTATDGAVYTFSILTYSALRLLKLLQNLIEVKRARDPELKDTKAKMGSGDLFNSLVNEREAEHAGEDKVGVEDVDPSLGERGAARARRGHVDGDCIWRYLEYGGSVRTLVEEGAQQEVRVLFEGLVADIRREAAVPGDVGGTMEWAETWTRDILMPVL